jgi:hypothetical protein
MDSLWLILYALGGAFAFYAVAAGAILIISRRGSLVEMPSGETIFFPPGARAAPQALAYHHRAALSRARPVACSPI